LSFSTRQARDRITSSRGHGARQGRSRRRARRHPPDRCRNVQISRCSSVSATPATRPPQARHGDDDQEWSCPRSTVLARGNPNVISASAASGLSRPPRATPRPERGARRESSRTCPSSSTEPRDGPLGARRVDGDGRVAGPAPTGHHRGSPATREALSDGPVVKPERFAALMERVRRIARAMTGTSSSGSGAISGYAVNAWKWSEAAPPRRRWPCRLPAFLLAVPCSGWGGRRPSSRSSGRTALRRVGRRRRAGAARRSRCPGAALQPRRSNRRPRATVATAPPQPDGAQPARAARARAAERRERAERAGSSEGAGHRRQAPEWPRHRRLPSNRP